MKSITSQWLVGYFISAWAMVAGVAAIQKPPPIIPAPQRMELREGSFRLTPQTQIYADTASMKTVEFLAEPIHRSTGYPLKIGVESRANTGIPNAILLTTWGADTNLGAEGYSLTVTTNAAIVCAPAQAGVFYGVQTLLQLLPPEIFSTNRVPNVNWQMPCVQIEDWPRFKWRGLMLDVSRHFYTTTEVETLLDLMAQQKLNVFHWHLVDDQGWRLQIEKYPKLTRIGAWRKDIGWGLDPKSSTAYNAEGKYGGYYTQDDVRKIVDYAAARHIVIVPEIEMPGHSKAALAAYPQFGVLDATNQTAAARDVPVADGRPNHGVYDPANPGTFVFLENILTEVFRLFPGQYVHIGGDEVRKSYWASSPSCRALMKREGLKDEKELQSWFIKRIETFVSAHGRRLVGWSEILQGGLAPDAVVMDWIGGGREAASEDHDAVMTPRNYCYLNFYQTRNFTAEPRAPRGRYTSLQKVYSFEPVPTNLPPQFQSHILGAQANLWTEWIASLSHAEYMLFPRLCALAEVDWSPKDARNWPDFQRRLKAEEQRLAERGVNYHRDASATALR